MKIPDVTFDELIDDLLPPSASSSSLRTNEDGLFITGAAVKAVSSSSLNVSDDNDDAVSISSSCSGWIPKNYDTESLVGIHPTAKRKWNKKFMLAFEYRSILDVQFKGSCSFYLVSDFVLNYPLVQWGSWKNSLNWRKVFKCLNFI